MRTGRIKLLIVYCLVLSITILVTLPKTMAMGSDPASKTRQKLMELSTEEKNVVQALFSLTHDIDAMEREEKKLGDSITALKGEIDSMEEKILKEEKNFEEKRQALGDVLRLYQKNGPASYLEIILSSENLNMFLWRISTLQDLSHNTGELLNTLKISKEKLEKEKSDLVTKTDLLEKNHEDLEKALADKVALRNEKEKYLASLSDKKRYYLEELGTLEGMWADLKTIMSRASEEFTRIIREESIPEDSFRISFSLFGIEGTLGQDSFNMLVSKSPALSKMSFSFHKDSVEIKLPEMDTVIKGKFEIASKNVIRFIPEGGSFYGISLEPNTIEELFEKGSLSMDFNQLLGEYTLNSVEVNEGNMKFIIKALF